MRHTKPRTERVSLEIPIDLKKRLRFYSAAKTKEAGYFVSMTACALDLLSTHLPPVPGELNGHGKKAIQRVLSPTGT